VVVYKDMIVLESTLSLHL